MPTEPPMTTKYESADLLLRLYDLRREPVLRKARAWFREEVRPRTTQDVLVAYRGKRSAYYRMLTTSWGMAATLVLHGAIDEQMFADGNGEHTMVYARLRPFPPELREHINNPRYLENLQQVTTREPAAQPPRTTSPAPAAERRATIALFSGLDADALERRGTANNNPITVRALAWIIVGHERHHVGIVRERYLA